MTFVTTNIRIPEDDYLAIKAEAAKTRKSMSEIIRERIATNDQGRSKERAKVIMAKRNRIAKELAGKLKGFDIVKALREMRYQGKW